MFRSLLKWSSINWNVDETNFDVSNGSQNCLVPCWNIHMNLTMIQETSCTLTGLSNVHMLNSRWQHVIFLTKVICAQSVAFLLKKKANYKYCYLVNWNFALLQVERSHMFAHAKMYFSSILAYTQIWSSFAVWKI